MPGGPINGSGVYGIDLKEANIPGSKPAATIIVSTILQISSDVVDSFADLTCIYDRYWYARPEMMTLPICFFYVKKISEVMQTDTSEQRIILYEPQMADADAIMKNLADPIRPGVQEVIVDNSCLKPKVYNLEIILPFQPFSKQMARTVNEAKQIAGAMVEIFAGAVESAPVISPYQAFDGFSQAAAVFSDNAGAKYINKNSLEAMWSGQKVLTMKMWTGRDYKYVQIVNLEINKEGTEDDVFRATMQVKERPVLTMTPATDANLPSTIDRNWAAQVLAFSGQTFSTAMAEFTGVREASGSPIV
jgi:hypothetical protein